MKYITKKIVLLFVTSTLLLSQSVHSIDKKVVFACLGSLAVGYYFFKCMVPKFTQPSYAQKIYDQDGSLIGFWDKKSNLMHKVDPNARSVEKLFSDETSWQIISRRDRTMITSDWFNPNSGRIINKDAVSSMPGNH